MAPATPGTDGVVEHGVKDGEAGAKDADGGLDGGPDEELAAVPRRVGAAVRVGEHDGPDAEEARHAGEDTDGEDAEELVLSRAADGERGEDGEGQDEEGDVDGGRDGVGGDFDAEDAAAAGARGVGVEAGPEVGDGRALEDVEEDEDEGGEGVGGEEEPPADAEEALLGREDAFVEEEDGPCGVVSLSLPFVPCCSHIFTKK